MLGKYVKVILSGKFGIVNPGFTFDGVEYWYVVLNNFNTCLVTESEVEIIY